MRSLKPLLLSILLFPAFSYGQKIFTVDLQYNANLDGFDSMDVGGKKVVVVAEDVHNRKYAPVLSFKLLQFLHAKNGVQVLAIEGGTSTAYLLNRYLANQDSVLLREIVRHTFYWSREHYELFVRLAEWNQSLPPEKRVRIESADIEIKQESVVLAMNTLLDARQIPMEINVLQEFRKIFTEKEGHRKRYAALNVEYYYDKKRCSDLVGSVLKDVAVKEAIYRNFFRENFEMFRTMMSDLQVLYVFNYRRESRFNFRDKFIYEKLVTLTKKNPEGFLYVVGARHTSPGASSHLLQYNKASPGFGKVVTINLTGRKSSGKYVGAKTVTRLAKHHPDIFTSSNHVLIQNEMAESAYSFDYTIAFGDNHHVTPFSNSFTGSN